MCECCLLHLCKCICVHLFQYFVCSRPINLPLRCLLSVGSLSISSNLAARTSCSILRFIAEDAFLFISDKMSPSVELRLDYVCVLDLGSVFQWFTYILHSTMFTILKSIQNSDYMFKIFSQISMIALSGFKSWYIV